jgi:glutamate/aspartate transport system substrate-binding protein
LWAIAQDHEEVAQLLQSQGADSLAADHSKQQQGGPAFETEAKSPPDKLSLTGTLKTIEESRTISIGHRQSAVPFSFVGPDRQPIGYSIDLCQEIVDAIAAETGSDSLRIEWIPVTPQDRIALIANGTIQMECGATTNTLSRQQEVDFTHVTFITGTKLLVKKDSGIREIEDLDGKRVAVTQGTTNENAVRALVRRQGLTTKIQTVRNHLDGLRALEAGEIDAYATDHVLLEGLLQDAAQPEALAIVGRFLSYEPYGIMVPKDDSAFRLVANRALSRLFRDGDINKVYARWFEPLAIAMPPELEAAFRLQALPE